MKSYRIQVKSCSLFEESAGSTIVYKFDEDGTATEGIAWSGDSGGPAIIDGKIIKNSLDLSIRLLDKQSVVSVSGDSFGSDNNIRFSYATSEDVINKAMNKLEVLIDECE